MCVFGRYVSSFVSTLLIIGGTEVNDDLEAIETSETGLILVGKYVICIGAAIVLVAINIALFVRLMNHKCVTGTPGRLADIMERKNLLLKEFEVLVMDEADALLDLGFGMLCKGYIHVCMRMFLPILTMTYAYSLYNRINID
jgi:hypothetical protein